VARRPRLDSSDSWHHVWGRGLAHKPIFEHRQDIRRFQAALARAVRRGDLEVHSFAFLTTHFHLLVRSPRGLLSQALGRVLWDYTRHYNRTRGRDGTVWRGRFSSKPVRSLTYRRVLVRYIDANPVQAGLSDLPWTYEHGSAQRFVHGTPPWLTRTWIDQEVRRVTGKSPAEGGRYEDAFPPANAGEARLAEARSASPSMGPDPLDHLLDAAPPEVAQWLEEQSRLADGMSVGQPVVDPVTLAQALSHVGVERSGWKIRLRRKAISPMRVLAVGLYRDLAGLSLSATARRVRFSVTHVKKLLDDHRALSKCEATYREATLDVTLRALASLRANS
jgi:REP element-mobilizing transposase RayT